MSKIIKIPNFPIIFFKYSTLGQRFSLGCCIETIKTRDILLNVSTSVMRVFKANIAWPQWELQPILQPILMITLADGSTGKRSLVRANNLNLVLGFCLPASCSPEKVVEYSSNFLTGADLTATSAICRTNDPIPFEALAYFAMWVFRVWYFWPSNLSMWHFLCEDQFFLILAVTDCWPPARSAIQKLPNRISISELYSRFFFLPSLQAQFTKF